MNIITASNINKTFKNKGENANHILRDISLSIEKGKITSLMGASGVGKSTLLYILGTLESMDSGEITISIGDTTYDYSKLNERNISLLRSKHIGFIFQFHHLLPEFTVLENIMMPALLLNLPYKDVKVRAMELMKQFGILDTMEHKPSSISGGEQQRAAIARAMVNSPDIIFADEPTGNLDSTNTDNVIHLISKINAEMGITFLIATHSQQVAEHSDTIVKMKDGKIV
ncbi:MAG: ABC transporter ATP-binding protein [Ignavibacteria bacterium]|jgi:lipoprotein-releasing system ATP-binding protein|nr:ABC transporter ATP-binding protein [Ignavibacteria bacterium]